MKKWLLAVLLCIFLSACEVGIQGPPQPVLTVGKKEIMYEIGPYSWHKNGEGIAVDTAGPEELVEHTNAVAVPPGAVLVIDFKYRPDGLEAGIWKNEQANFKRVKHNKIMLPNKKGTYIYIIHAKWKEGDATYALRIATK
ncbi:hypothetical protein [Pseudobacillus wudalianchiensis]|uniref:Lipoprotein n=1 Tax=Pseudobacillus wudalianchiensis TaxID=1743143 RepID=A0A1B9AMM0_9BACI|nr:hypothetical protein [Bacillus wudalianchiensis]OCA85173.1 hypothetical protein A8F95_10875 [Bacillus wudalianchiensis]